MTVRAVQVCHHVRGQRVRRRRLCYPTTGKSADATAIRCGQHTTDGYAVPATTNDWETAACDGNRSTCTSSGPRDGHAMVRVRHRSAAIDAVAAVRTCSATPLFNEVCGGAHHDQVVSAAKVEKGHANRLAMQHKSFVTDSAAHMHAVTEHATDGVLWEHVT